MPELPEIGIDPMIDEAALAEALDNGRKVILRDALSPLSHLSWKLVRSNIAEALQQALGANAISAFAQGWSAARELWTYRQPGKVPPDKRVFLKLGKHQLKGILHPVVTVTCNEIAFPALTFDVPMTADLNAVSIAILNGHITGLGGGECTMTVQINYDGAQLSGPIPVKTLKLPAEYGFDNPGIRIP